MQISAHLLNLLLFDANTLVHIVHDPLSMLTSIDPLLQLLGLLLLLLKFLFRNGSQINQLANLNLVLHELRVPLGELSNGFNQLIIDSHLVFEGSPISKVKLVYLISLIF